MIREVAKSAPFNAHAIVLNSAALPKSNAAILKYSDFIKKDPAPMRKAATAKKAPKSPSCVLSPIPVNNSIPNASAAFEGLITKFEVVNAIGIAGRAIINLTIFLFMF